MQTINEFTKEKLQCQICGKEFMMIAPAHLKYKHGITMEEYKRKYPEAKTIPDWLRKEKNERISKATRRSWKNPSRKAAASNRCKLQWENLETRERLLTSLNSRECKIKQSGNRKSNWGDPKYRLKMERIRNTPKYRARRSNLTKSQWQTPEFRNLFEGENNPMWKGGISYEPYCSKFNSHLKEKIRNRYGRICMNCGKNEIENERRLDVHHVDGNKMQGCDGHDWFLIPLCRSCNARHLEESDFHKLLFWLKKEAAQ